MHLWNIIIDRFLSVNSQRVLNSEEKPTEISADIAATLRSLVDQLKMEGYDTERGRVDYERLRESTNYHKYKQVTAELRTFNPSLLVSRPEKMAFWINLYNSLIVDAVITLGIRKSIWEAGKGFFRQVAYEIGGLRYSADDIEHGILRGNRPHPIFHLVQFERNDPRSQYAITPMDPRIHFTLVCASRSCPFITVYHAANIEEELEIATSSFINGGGVIIDSGAGKVRLSPIFKWFQADFGGRSGLIEFILRYLVERPKNDILRQNMAKVRIGYQEYDWSLNRL